MKKWTLIFIPVYTDIYIILQHLYSYVYYTHDADIQLVFFEHYPSIPIELQKVKWGLCKTSHYQTYLNKSDVFCLVYSCLVEQKWESVWKFIQNIVCFLSKNFFHSAFFLCSQSIMITCRIPWELFPQCDGSQSSFLHSRVHFWYNSLVPTLGRSGFETITVPTPIKGANSIQKFLFGPSNCQIKSA